MPSPEQVLALRYTRQHNRIRTASAAAVGRAWDSLADLDDRAAERFAAAAATLSTAAQAEAAANLDGYLGLLLNASPVGIDLDTVTGAAVRAGAEPADVYLRSIITARAKVSEGGSFVDAMRAGRVRAVSTAETDVALTQRAAMASEERIVGYRRVLTGKSCGLCGTASTQRYHSGQLMPIHNRCDCGVAPIMGKKDPGHVINKQLLSDLKKSERFEGTARHLTVTEDGTVELPKIAVHQHDELGPVLTDAAHDFSTVNAA